MKPMSQSGKRGTILGRSIPNLSFLVNKKKKTVRYRWLCERARQMGLDEEEWEDMSDDDENDDDDEEEDKRIADISTAECVLDGKNQREIPLTECFFSGHVSPTIDDNLAYMETKFGFFIPW